MKSGDLTTGPAKLHKAWELLLIRWDETKLVWRDTVSEKFEENYLKPIGDQIQASLDQMRSLTSTLIAAEHDCNR